MTEQNKNLLLNYLCMAQPYGVNFILSGSNYNNVYTIKGIDLIATDEGVWDYGVTTKNTEPIEIKYIKPYLRPLSSMTEEEKKEFDSISDEGFGKALDLQIAGGSDLDVTGLEITASYNNIQWLLKNHFDFMDLIPKGLALKAPEGMYNNKMNYDKRG